VGGNPLDPEFFPSILKHESHMLAESVAIPADEFNTTNPGLFSLEHLREHARDLAGRLTVVRQPRASADVFARVRSSAHEIQQTHQLLTAAGKSGDAVSRDAEWLLDNYYVVEEQLHEIDDDLPPHYFAELPKLENGEPRVYQIATELILHTDGLLDETTIVGFVQAFQEVTPLSIGEVWAVPIMLRIGLIEYLGRLATEIHRSRRQRSIVATSLNGWSCGSELPVELQTTADHDLLAIALMAVDECSADDVARLAPLEPLLLAHNPGLHDRVREFHQKQAASQISVGNAITAMRLLSALDWVAFFEACSHVEQILRTDPARAYANMDYESRDRYRHALESIARHSAASEIEVAQTAIAHAKKCSGNRPCSVRQRHVGYWLVDEGRVVLEAAVQCRPTLFQRVIAHLRQSGLPWYSGAILALTCGGTAAVLTASIGWGSWLTLWICLPLFIAISDFAVGVVNYLFNRIMPPRILPKLEFRDGIPADCRTVVIVPSMLTSLAEVAGLLQRLELHYVANPEPHLSFALLTDLADAQEAVTETDSALIAAAQAGIQRLNVQYGTERVQPFYLFHRHRQWNPQENCWMGWERKRGKLTEFNRLLLGAQETSFSVQVGDLDSLVGATATPVRYVITCDADTQLPHGVARRLVGSLAHPLNQPCFDDQSQRIVAGYSLIQPRVSVALADGQKSWYVRIMANSRGIDPYATAASDVYQDTFGEGSFTGKGIYELLAFERSLAGAFGENQILSHDLIEGCHLRTALASDIELIDGYPTRYDADAQRQHRWVRGDWQISPWLRSHVPAEQGKRKNPLSLLSQWKIADNLRRSLVPPAIGIVMLLGWSMAPAYAWLWSLAGLTCLGTPVLIALIASLENLSRSRDWSTGLRTAAASLKTALLQLGVLMVSLPHRAGLMIDAIARTLWRMQVTRKHLLEWQTAAAAEQRLIHRKWSSLIQFICVAACAVALAVTLPRMALPAAAIWLIAWLNSPWILQWISRPRRLRKVVVDRETRHWLRLVARRNWSYFEDNLNARNHWLPPDNVQEYPHLRIADRLSPTNEGLFLVSVLAARDFGYLSLHPLVQWWERNLHSLCQLPRTGGHFFNWYDTQTMQPLRPRYLSTVDSGNLAASLLVMRQGIDELRHQPILDQALWNGLTDTVSVTEEPYQTRISAVATQAASQAEPNHHDDVCAALKNLRRVASQPVESFWDWPRHVQTLRTCARLLELARTDLPVTPTLNGQHEAQEGHSGLTNVALWLEGFLSDYDRLFAWVDLFVSVDEEDPSSTPDLPHQQTHWQHSPECRAAWSLLKSRLSNLRTLADLMTIEDQISEPLDALQTALAWSHADQQNSSAGHRWLTEFSDCSSECGRHARDLDQRFQSLATCVQTLIDEMDFEPLYDPLRRLFSIGYNLEDGRLDGSYYDLLCSEARLSSYIAIAKGDVPVKHWFCLGRQTTYAAGQIGMLSWGGTMFEFLMPLIFQPRIRGSLLAAACETAVLQQRQYARQRGVPWGVSESAFASLSPNSDYQYQSFGVPGLGLKRGLSRDNVIAPYATMLALEVDPSAAIQNLRRFERDGLLARWGFYEAVDYTESRLPTDRKSVPVRCFMAHHQGMSFLSLSNLLNNESIRRRFRADPLMRAAELLLQEGVPVSSQVMTPHADELAEVQIVRAVEAPVVSRRIGTYDTPTPRAHLLSNGSYAVMLTNAGGGYSRWRDLAISRWRSDTTRDHWGQWLYINDSRAGAVWSATYQPTLTTPDEYEVIFSIDKAEFRRRDGEIESSLEVAISPEDAVEVRQLKLTNLSRKPRTIDITSYVEVVLARPEADLAHPAFQKLFVETEYVPESQALLARRRPRSADEPVQWAVHVLCPGDSTLTQIEYETSLARFLGRGRTPQNPAALDLGQRLSGETGPVLDPILAFRCSISIAAEESRRVAFMTGYASTRQEALRLADLYHDWRAVQRAYELAWAYNQMELRHWRATATQTHRFQRLASAVLYPQALGRGSPTAILNNRLHQSDLWPFGISGDRPIVLVRVDQARQLAFIRELLIAQEFFAYRLLHIDVVLLNCLPGSYLDELQEQLERLIRETPHRAEVGPGMSFVLRYSQLTSEQMQLLEAVAAVVIDAGRGWAHAGLQLSGKVEAALPVVQAVNKSAISLRTPTRVPPSLPNPAANHGSHRNGTAALEQWNGFGGFADEGRVYRIATSTGQATPMPWSNVLANEQFGCLITEMGGGYTWAVNSRENKLTTWCNDPVSDPPAEQIYLQDSSTADLWPLFGRSNDSRVSRVAEHGCGWSRWIWSTAGLQATVTVSVATDDPVKFIEVEVQNDTSASRELVLTYYAELVLGVTREESRWHVVTEVDTATQALLARNAYHPEFPNQVVFLHALGERITVTGDRAEFLGRNGHLSQPAGLKSPQLTGSVGAGLDPCGAVQTRLTIGPRKSGTVSFLLGRGKDAAQARDLLQTYARPARVMQAQQQARADWDEILETLQVQTPNRALDLMVNRWLVYQTLACRIWGRSAYYQASGAYGFRDQLQDVMAVVYARPDVMREHLLRAASRQYVEGDVQHWWHVPTGRGTRTRFSDDLLWLILAACHYVDVTQDETIWNEQAAFLESPPLKADEHERYEQPSISLEQGTLYEHCLRALRRGFRLGAHGLPLMGCGDWNDGMNKVGELGRGESVWVGWFLIVILDRFLPVMRQRGDQRLAEEYQEQREALLLQLEQQAWDGAWYRRAFFDDGTPLGSHTNTECQIDSITQSWAVLANADEDRTAQALDAVVERLVRPSDHLVALLTPPFDQSTPNPGYIAGYLKGVRENGGQYTHAVLWLIQALTIKGDGDRAMAIFDLINPVRQAATPKDVARYQVEPYVMAADVYSEPPNVGRGGWTWYTGSASWTYRTAVENMLGLQLRGRQVSFRPCVPANWSHFEVALRVGESLWRFRIELHGDTADTTSEDDAPGSTRTVTMEDDGREHHVTLHCRRPVSAEQCQLSVR